MEKDFGLKQNLKMIVIQTADITPRSHLATAGTAAQNMAALSSSIMLSVIVIE